jgi:hypothetical protein
LAPRPVQPRMLPAWRRLAAARSSSSWSNIRGRLTETSSSPIRRMT